MTAPSDEVIPSFTGTTPQADAEHTRTGDDVCGGQDADGTCAQVLQAVGLRVRAKGSDSRGACSRDSSVVRRMLLSES